MHPAQSLELYRHLKVLDQAPVRLVLYPGERHGNRRAASRYDYNLRMIQWIEQYLQGPAERRRRTRSITAASPRRASIGSRTGRMRRASLTRKAGPTSRWTRLRRNAGLRFS